MSRKAETPARSSLRSLIGASLIFFLALLLLGGLKGYRDYSRASLRVQELEQGITATNRSIQGLEQRIDRLRNDPQTLERLAREDLGMVLPDDVVLILPVEETPAGDSTSQ